MKKVGSVVLLILLSLGFSMQENASPAKVDTYALISKLSKGQKHVIKGELRLDIDSTTKDANGGASTTSLSLVKKESFVQEVWESTKKGYPQTLQVKCIFSTLEKSGTLMAPTGAVRTSLDGKTFILKGQEAGFSVETKDGAIAKEETVALGRWNDYLYFLPDKEVKIGETWKIDSEDVIALLYDLKGIAGEGAFQCLLKGVQENKATVSLSSTLEGKAKEGEFKAALSGELLFDIQKGIPISIKLSGDFTAGHKAVEKSVLLGGVTFRSRKFELTLEFEEGQ